MIPVNKKEAIERALQTTFGTDTFEDIRLITEGLSSAMIFKIVVHEKPYLLKVITRTDAISDPSLYFDSMSVAAEAGIAPHMLYNSFKDRISITDFINEKVFTIDEARKQMPRVLQQLHRLPKFPFRINYFSAMEGFMKKFQSAGLLPENEIKDVFKLYDRIATIYPRNDRENWVSCHNDLKPENIIFDGIRPWLVDWEGAFLNDRYLDLLVTANFLVQTENDETNYLEQYFGEPADEYKHVRFFAMATMLHVYYFVFLSLSGAAGKPIDLSKLDEADFHTFHNSMWNGEISLAGNEQKLQYAWVHKKEFIRKTQTSRLQTSLKVLQSFQK